MFACLKHLPLSLFLECPAKSLVTLKEMETVYKGGWLLWNGICGMPLFWMSCRLPNSTETQIKTVICQLKQDFTQAWNGLYVIWWYGTNLDCKKQNHKTTYKFDNRREKMSWFKVPLTFRMWVQKYPSHKINLNKLVG